MRPLRIRLEEARKRTGLPWEILEKDYILSWVLAGISRVDALRDTLIFKGGTALKKCYFGDYRFSVYRHGNLTHYWAISALKLDPDLEIATDWHTSNWLPSKWVKIGRRWRVKIQCRSTCFKHKGLWGQTNLAIIYASR